MDISLIFRYLDKKYYSGYSSFYDFVEDYSFSKEEINRLDDFGYNLLHYCSLKSNIVSECSKILLKQGGDMYITSKNEGLTPFEIALKKKNVELINLYISHGYDITREDDLGFKLKDKLEDEITMNADFYSEIIEILSEQGLNLKKDDNNHLLKPETTNAETRKDPISYSMVDKYLEMDDYKAVAIHLRTEMENIIYEKVLKKIGIELDVLINNRSLNDLIYDMYNLKMITYDVKEFYISSKNILNYYCHRGDSKNQFVNDFINKEKKDQKTFFKNLEKVLMKD